MNFSLAQVYFISDPVQWTELLNLFEYSDIYHTFDYVNLESARIGGSPCMALIQMGTGLIGLPLIFRKIPNESRYIDAISVYGYNGILSSASLTPDDFTSGVDKIKQALVQRDCVSFFNRESNFTTYRLPESIPTGKVLGVDLTQSTEVYEKSIPRRIRQQIKALHKLNYTVTESLDPKTISEFCEIYRQTMLRRNAQPHYFFSYNYFEKLLNIDSSNVKLMAVYHEGMLVCGSIFATKGEHMYYLFSGSKIHVTPYPTSRLIFDEVIRKNLKTGKKILHLGGGLGGEVDTVYQFKNAFGKIVLPFHTTKWILIPEVYNRLTLNSSDNSSFFPKYRSS